jgi:hypothetical protein
MIEIGDRMREGKIPKIVNTLFLEELRMYTGRGEDWERVKIDSFNFGTGELALDHHMLLERREENRGMEEEKNRQNCKKYQNTLH